MRARRVCQRGQAATETMLMMLFLLSMIFGLIHLCMLMSMKYMVNFAAFSAARTSMVQTKKATINWAAAEAMSYVAGLPPYTRRATKTIRRKRRSGYEAIWHPPGASPLLIFRGFSPAAVQPPVPQKGDNR